MAFRTSHNMRAYYSADLSDFLQQSTNEVLGIIHTNDASAETTIQQSNTWEAEVRILKDQLRNLNSGRIIFEYTIPRMGKRVDVVVLYRSIVFLLEFKCGDEEYRQSTYDQVYDYALDLRNFQKESHDKLLVPMMISTRAPRYQNTLTERDRIIEPIRCNGHNIGIAIEHVATQYPIVITRDLRKAKSWVRDKCQGTTRYGLLASSGGLRLKPEGIFVKNEISVANWFLNGKDDVRSSYMLEDVVSEFDIQGLELDYSIVAWDADYRYVNGAWTYNSFVGHRWTNVSSDERRLYLKNAYRVLLTRARQGMAIFVPEGSSEDSTRKTEWYDGIFEYLKSVGIPVLE